MGHKKTEAIQDDTFSSYLCEWFRRENESACEPPRETSARE